MDELQKQMNNLDIIQENIKKNNLYKNSDTQNLNSILNLTPHKKKELDKKIITIKRFINKIDNIYKTKPNPKILNKNLVKYIDYT